MQAEIAAQNDRGREVNIGQIERVASVGLGAALVVVGLALRSRRGLGLALTGAGMAYRGLGGRCLVYRALGIHGASGKPTATGNLGVKVERSAPIDAPPEKLYAFWRDFRNLPIVMPNLERVEVQSDTRSHWVVKGPLGTAFEWDAEIINEVDGYLLAWQSLPGSDVDSAGSVRMRDLPGGSTELTVHLQYQPPAGRLGAWAAWMTGEEPSRQIHDDLRAVKRYLETGVELAAH